ncbi:unnamed protein product [Protopolystoma xenopodis]|uniref:Uncharacterized protein n=1 Tax=Protopolystoma xenopodis TaxID=117903 RepID=A0A448WMT4_9PLAT|nr:unnamed protein product [Protopolystoma xenopodis]
MTFFSPIVITASGSICAVIPLETPISLVLHAFLYIFHYICLHIYHK